MGQIFFVTRSYQKFKPKYSFKKIKFFGSNFC
jgi:hypothetical protein